MHATGEVYQVQEAKGDTAHGETWHEYTASLVCDCGQVIDEWDSYTETYNGIQWLDRKSAGDALAQIQAAVKAGDADNWFSPMQCPSCGRTIGADNGA